MPTGRKLPYLAHVREVDTSDKTALALKDAGVFSLVVANRFPLPGTATIGAKNIAHLVSLEGFGDLLTGSVPAQPEQDQVKLISLFSWTFSCLADPSQKFSGLAQNLAYDQTGQWRAAGSLLVRIPYQPSGATDAATVMVEQRLAAGYVALGYHTRSGDDGFAWYRGPLTPVVTAPIAKSGPFFTADAAMIYDAADSVFDTGLAAAWQIGHQLALANPAFATAVLRLRLKAGQNLIYERTGYDRCAGGRSCGASRTCRLSGEWRDWADRRGVTSGE